ncbi:MULTISPECIES: TAXI family TRAP transporter solute-binding subunit [Haloferax]|uniref:NMT1/THI5 like protein n=1 Tax=Haloferax massiliensis TaxID=1476858 RepID=A0A0D6JNE3_9EURY|nr:MULTISPECIES: TAXI family TRAP transporter solute-binding subunit [Haloferax]MDS0243460.1 TAXI family TRAP transporter solute-binding subunit [Haloferax sp. S2CR25]MDS0446581.1 TAXI family TRAP transporter solute-binding subunit [Haloferax sp. S2CR25-2]CQR49133.1 NMT1/THI5 like protein [Haloferax massiliensis]
MTRKLDRRQFIAATGAAGLAGLAGCSGGGGEETTTTTTESGGEETTTADEETTTESGGNGGTESRLSWHAGGTGGTYYPLSNEFKSVVESQTDFTLQVQSTGASVENVGSLARGDADFALIQNDVAYFARNGEGIEAFQGSPVENLRGVATLYPETIHIVTLADTGIETPSDLSGATINTGDLGSGTQVNATQILEALGISDYSEQNTGFSQASDQLKNGDIDAAFVVGGWPVGAIEELAATEDVRIVPIEGDNRTAVKDAAPFYADDEVPSGTYGLENPAPTVSVQAMIATNAEQPEATVEAVTDAIFDNVDQLTIKTEFISKESAQDGMSIELHPGAQAYFG